MSWCIKFVRKCWAETLEKGGHDNNVLSGLRFIHAKPGRLDAALKIEKRHINNHDTIHGGVLLNLTDTLTSLAITTLGYHPSGVSVNISAEFVRPGGKEGDELFGISQVVKIGKSLAYTRITFYDSADRIVAYGSHTKHMGAATEMIKFEKSGQREELIEQANKAKM